MTLSEAHRQMLEVESRISPEAIAARRYDSIGPDELERLGWPRELGAALHIPGMTPSGQAWPGVVRPDVPPRDSKGKPKKYLQRAGDPPHLDVNPLNLRILKDVTKPIAIVEGTKKADAVSSAGLPTISLNGVYGLFKNGAVNPEADEIALKGRTVYVIFDSDAGSNRKVRAAERRTVADLVHRGAHVIIIRLPPTTDGKKQGADDYLAAGHSLAEMLTMALGELDAQNQDDKRITSADIAATYTRLGHTFGENELTDSTYMDGEPLTDAAEANLRNQLRDAGISALAHARDVMLALAAAGKFNPAKVYIERAAWDGIDHIGLLAGYVTDRDRLFPLALRRWLLGAVDRVYREGAQNRMLVLVGAQGLGKSGLVAYLTRDLEYRYTVQAGIRPDEKDDQVRLAETLIWEVTELGSTTRRADVDALKAFISLTHVNVRRPYAKHATDAPAITSFVGTLNDSHAGFLSDPTGERRFVVCELTHIDWAYAQDVNIAQVWAQAKALYDRGERGQFTPKEMADVNTVNARYFTEALSHSALDKIIEPDADSFVPTDFIVKELKKLGYSGNDDKLAKDVSDYMTRKIAAGEKITKKRQRVEVEGQEETKKLMGWVGVSLIITTVEGPFTHSAKTGYAAEPVEPTAKPAAIDFDRLGGTL